MGYEQFFDRRLSEEQILDAKRAYPDFWMGGNPHYIIPFTTRERAMELLNIKPKNVTIAFKFHTSKN